LYILIKGNMTTAQKFRSDAHIMARREAEFKLAE